MEKERSHEMQVFLRQANQTFQIGHDIEVVVPEFRGNIARPGISAPLECSAVRFELIGKPSNNQLQPGGEVTGASGNNLEVNLTSDAMSNRLLHQFCERRKLWQMSNAIQALCVSALAAVADGNVPF